MPIQIVHRDSLTGLSRFVNPWSGEENTVSTNNSYPFYNGRAIDIFDGTIRAEVAPGSGNIWRMEMETGQAAGQIGNDVDLTNPNLDVRSAITGTWSASTGPNFTTSESRSIRLRDGSGSPPAGQAIQWVFQYEDANDPTVSYYGFGDRLFNLMSGAGAFTTRYTTFAIADSVASTQDAAQMVWPATGKFQYVTFVYSVATGASDVALVLQINGSDTAIAFTLSDSGGAGVLVDNQVLTASVSEGDLVNWRIQNGAVANSVSIVLLCGFHR